MVKSFEIYCLQRVMRQYNSAVYNALLYCINGLKTTTVDLTFGLIIQQYIIYMFVAGHEHMTTGSVAKQLKLLCHNNTYIIINNNKLTINRHHKDIPCS